jgi:hypothetical protein
MRLQLAEGPKTESPLDKASKIINSVQAVKNIPFVGEALTIANGLVNFLNAKERAAFDKTLKEARMEPPKWWANEGKTGSPWEPMTPEKAAWLVDRLGSAVQSESRALIGLRAGTGKVSKARWVKAYQTLLDEIVAKQKEIKNPPLIPGLPSIPGLPGGSGSGIGRFLPLIIGGAVVLWFITRKK